MTWEEAYKEADELRGRFDAPYNSFDKQTIRKLYVAVLGLEMKPTSCQSCYHDALIEIYSRLKKTKVMANEINYRMRAGFIINCPNFRKGEIFTNDNLTDEVAAEYLEMFPENRNMFQKLPATEQEAKQAAKGRKKKG